VNTTRKIGVVISALAVLGAAAGIASTMAGASSTTVTASTAVSSHPDTTNASGPACTSSANGPVWANDAYTSQLTATKSGTSWNVTIQDNGSYKAFADPTTCAALTSSGNFLFLYHVTVTSANSPAAANLHASYSGAVSTTQMVRDLFNDQTAAVDGGAYFASYQNGAYVQAAGAGGASFESYGDVAATPPPPVVKVKVPSVAGLSASAALAKIRAAGFVSYTSPFRNPAYTYVATGTTPAAGTLAPKGSTVVVLVKRG